MKQTNKAESERTWQALRVCSKFEQQISRCIEKEHAACHFNLLKVQLFPLQDLNAVN
jgi:hypothetical protein